MTADEAVARAREFARQRDWTFLDPVQVRAFRPWWLGAMRWRVVSNHENKGCNVRIEIDDQRAEIVKGQFIPR
jgi:hypothetical protein